MNALNSACYQILNIWEKEREADPEGLSSHRHILICFDDNPFAYDDSCFWEQVVTVIMHGQERNAGNILTPRRIIM